MMERRMRGNAQRGDPREHKIGPRNDIPARLCTPFSNAMFKQQLNI